ncbi:MAG: PilZ domain-containing protein [Spirochaetes bacterium]|nr:PilZ domain-containing protein [Spirochaetota bacterium]
MKTEKRNFTRITYNHLADIKYMKKYLSDLPIQDISLKGCFLIIKETDAFKENDKLEIIIKLSVKPDIKIKLNSRIIRVNRKKGLAVYFESMDFESFQNLKNILEFNVNEADVQKINKELMNLWSKKRGHKNGLFK